MPGCEAGLFLGANDFGLKTGPAISHWSYLKPGWRNDYFAGVGDAGFGGGELGAGLGLR